MNNILTRIEKFFTGDSLVLYGESILIFFAGYLLAKVGNKVVQRVYGKHLTEHGRMVLGRVFFYTIFLVTFFIALNHAGVNLSALIAAAGVATVAISFAAETSVSNVISGIFLLFDRPFSLGDTIKVDMTVGNVLSMGMLSSKVRTFDNLVVRIPNEVLLKSTIINYSLLHVRRIEIPVTIAHENNLYEVQQLILGICRDYHATLDEPEPVVLTDLIQDQGIQLLVRVWAERADFITVKSELSSRIIQALNEHAIKRPVMQRTVTLRQDAPLQVSTTQEQPRQTESQTTENEREPRD